MRGLHFVFISVQAFYFLRCSYTLFIHLINLTTLSMHIFVCLELIVKALCPNNLKFCMKYSSTRTYLKILGFRDTKFQSNY